MDWWAADGRDGMEVRWEEGLLCEAKMSSDAIHRVKAEV